MSKIIIIIINVTLKDKMRIQSPFSVLVIVVLRPTDVFFAAEASKHLKLIALECVWIEDFN